MEKSNLFKHMYFVTFIAIVVSIFFIFNDKNPKSYIMNSYFVICNRLEIGKNIDRDFIKKLLEKSEYKKGNSTEVLNLNTVENIKQSTYIFNYEDQEIHIDYDDIKKQIISVKYMDYRPNSKYNIFLSYNEMDRKNGEEYLSTVVYADSVKTQRDISQRKEGLIGKINRKGIDLKEAYFEIAKSMESNYRINEPKLMNLLNDTLKKTYEDKIIVRDKNGKEKELTSETYIFKKDETELAFEYIKENDNFRSVAYKNEIITKKYIGKDYANKEKRNYMYTKMNTESLKKQEKEMNNILLK